MPTTPQSVTLVIAIVDRPRRPGRNDQHVQAYSIRQPRMEGDSIAEISRKLEVSRVTVYKYLAMEDLSQRPPAPCAKASVLDRYRPLCLIRFSLHE